MVEIFLIIGGSIIGLMGAVHAVITMIDVFRPTQFTPIDESLRDSMKSTGVCFSRNRLNMWDAWLGFNISHGLGVFTFGVTVIIFGNYLAQIELSKMLLFAPVIIGLIYFCISVRFWFYLPTIGITIATACFICAWWLYQPT
ncbi:MAG: hypothetical protein JSU92_00015 [Deltaproteobacteria bacterium]|nr:MAG: hypothetical protein JSU92_00015 [Deltaproteobacteria bacterium]